MSIHAEQSNLHEYIDDYGQYHFPGEDTQASAQPTMLDTLKWLWTGALRWVGLA